jgi:hypothetical protein
MTQAEKKAEVFQRIRKASVPTEPVEVRLIEDDGFEWYVRGDLPEPDRSDRPETLMGLPIKWD